MAEKPNTPREESFDKEYAEDSAEQAADEEADAVEELVTEEDALSSLKADYEAKLQEMKDQLLRAMAETENTRRRAQRDVEETAKFAVSGFAKDMITVAEQLFLALSSVPEEERQKDGLFKSFIEGVDMTRRELMAAFEKHGIKRIDPLGEKFNHNFHQAVSQVEDPGKEPNTVLHVLQAGYVIGERLLRPAMVVVSKQGAQEQKVDTTA